jgi:LysR family cys regulon transcriptional activator
MKLQQLRYLCEIVNHGFNVSRAATALHTSQPGISKQVRLLEEELGVVLLERRSTRISGLTEAGASLLPTMQQMLLEGESLKRQAKEAASPAKAKLIIATTHTHARYVLPAMFRRFVQRHPQVSLRMRQARTERIQEMLRGGEADIGVTTEPAEPLSRIALTPCYRFGHSVITLPKHPLLSQRRLSFEHLLRYPIITYDERFKLGRLVDEEFEKRGIEPNIVVRAIDSDIAKAYVEAGFGVAVLMNIAYSRSTDKGLRAIPATHLFGEIVCYAMTIKDRPLSPYAKHFIELMQSVSVPGISR